MTLPIQSCNELRLLRNDHLQWITAAAASSCMQWITATAAPSCGQKKHTRWRSTSMLRSDHVQWITAACNELQLLLRHRAVRRNTHAGHDIPCYQLHRSEDYLEVLNLVTLQIQSCNELRLLRNEHLQWITAAAAPSCGQNKHTRWLRHSQATDWLCTVTGMQRITPAPTRSRAMNYRCCCVLAHAMNYSYCCAIVRSENTHTLAKYVYASKRSRAMNYRCMQWITAAAAPSCGQKKHTRWPRHTLLPTT